MVGLWGLLGLNDHTIENKSRYNVEIKTPSFNVWINIKSKQSVYVSLQTWKVTPLCWVLIKPATATFKKPTTTSKKSVECPSGRLVSLYFTCITHALLCCLGTVCSKDPRDQHLTTALHTIKQSLSTSYLTKLYTDPVPTRTAVISCAMLPSKMYVNTPINYVDTKFEWSYRL